MRENDRERERERRIRKFEVREVSKECNKVSREENNSDMFCYSSEALNSPFLSMVCFETENRYS